MNTNLYRPKRFLIAGLALISLSLPLAMAQQTLEPALSLQNWIEWRRQLNFPEVPGGLSSEAYRQRAETLAIQAAAAYPTAFYDQPLWNAAVHHAELAYLQEPQNPSNQRLLAELFTTTKFWYPAFLLWSELALQQSLNTAEQEQAALSAAKMGYYRHRMGMEAEAIAYLQESLRFQHDDGVAALLEAVVENGATDQEQ